MYRVLGAQNQFGHGNEIFLELIFTYIWVDEQLKCAQVSLFPLACL